jgi:hypothetical protein
MTKNIRFICTICEIVMNEVCKKMKLSMKYVELDGFYALSKQKKIDLGRY